MLELGSKSKKYHQEVVNLLEKKKFETCILVGSEFKKTKSTKQYSFVSSIKDCKKIISNQNIQNATILIKGSRKMKLEKLVSYL